MKGTERSASLLIIEEKVEEEDVRMRKVMRGGILMYCPSLRSWRIAIPWESELDPYRVPYMLATGRPGTKYAVSIEKKP
jgi:hypothetical protein